MSKKGLSTSELYVITLDRLFDSAKYFLGAYIAYRFSVALIAFSGHNTSLSIITFFETDIAIKATVGLGLSVGVSGIIYGRVQKKLKEDYIEKYAPLDAKKQKNINPKRKSSNLTVRGKTRKGD